MKQLMKRWLALGMSFAMAFTMIPAGSGDVVTAEETRKVKAASDDEATSSLDPGTSAEDPYKDNLLAAYDFDVESAAANTTIPDVSGNGKDATIKGTGATVADGMLTLPGGANNSGAAYVDIPGSVFENQDTLTISIWLKNETGSNNYAAMSFGTPTAHVGGGEADMPLNYWILNPAQPQGYFKSVWTNDNKSSAPYDTETAVSTTKTDSNWRMYTTVITENEIVGYYDGEEVSRASKTKKTSDFGTGLYACIGRSGYNDMYYKGGVYDVRVYNKALSEEGIDYLYNRGKLGFDKTALDLGDTSAVTDNLTLPVSGQNGSTITWSSDMPSVITDAGLVTRPETEENATVTLTATLELGGLKAEKAFTVTVLSGSVKGRFQEQVRKFNLDYSIVTEDITLPDKIEEEDLIINIDWSSNNSAVTIEKSGDKITGKVTQPENTLMVTLTAEFTCTTNEQNYTEEKKFIVCVRKAATIAKTAIATYDFADFTASGTNKLTATKDGKTVELTLESVGSGKKPELKDDADRGKVLSLTEQDYNNRGFALLPENPFAGKSVDNGFTLSFWTKTTGTPGGARCLVDFEVAPASSGKRAGTLAVNQQMVYWNTTDQNSKFTDFNIGNMNLTAANGWTMMTMTVTKTGIAFYRNGVKISHTVQSGAEDYAQMINDMAGTSNIATPEQTNVRLGASLATYWHCAGALLDDVSFYDKALSGDEVAGLFEETLIDKDFVALEGISLKASSDSVMKDETIQLTVTPTPANSSITRPVTWSIADETIVSVDADGVLTGLKAGTTTVKAIVAGVESDTVTITVKEPVESLASGYWLTVYSTTTPFYASASNLEQETRSVYMAVSKDGKSFEVLNNGGGVIFASTGSRQITSPRIYKVASEGKDTFTVVAPDYTASRGIHIFTSTDGVNYYDDTLTDSDEREALPLSKKSFKLLLNGENILDTDTAITLGNAVELTEEQYTYIVNKLGTVVNTGLDSLETLRITSEQSEDVTEAVLHEQYPNINALYSDGSTQNFKIDWSGALDNVDLSTNGDHTITGKVVQTKYENNLKELNGSNLPEDDPENVPANEGEFPDNYDPETGTVYYDSTKFIEGMADPRIYWDEETQYYYMTASYFPEEGDQIDANDKLEQYDRVVLRRGRTLEELQTRNGNQITIWKVGNQKFEDKNGTQADGHRYIWAPEIHRVGNYWVIYFTESHSSLFDIYCHALVLDGDKDPYATALTTSDGVSEWKDYKMRLSADVEGTDPFDTSFCLDMTYFKDEVNGQSYVLWPGKPSIGNTDIYIAKINPEKPWEITSVATDITKPEYGWERVRAIVNEGPTVLQRNGKIFMCYSGAGTGSEYAIGMLSAEGGTDLLDASNWTKSPYPLLTSRDVNGEEGPGHNSFTVDKDGNAIFVYHARPTSHNYQMCGWDGTKSTYNNEPLNDPCRHARLKRVHWAADGTPILKMTYEDELVDAYKTVSLTINVGEGGSELVVPVSKVTLDKEELILHEGESGQLTATVEPDNATHKDLTWESDNPSVAMVAEDGTVTAKSEGRAIITATAASEVSASCEVIVVKPGTPIVEVTEVKLDKTSVSLKEGETETLTATVVPDNATDQTIDWASEDETIAIVDQNGTITAVKAGETTITAKAGGKTAECKVTVTEKDDSGDPDDKVPVTGITLNKTTLSLKVNASETLTATVDPSNATDKTVLWSSSDSSVAKVENGKVTALKAGTAVITAKAGDQEAKCTVTVTADSTGGDGGNGGTGDNGGNSEIALTGIKLSQKTLKLGVKETFTLKATLQPANTTIKTRTPNWKSSKTSVATVNKSGKITAKKKGTTTITASIGNIKATCKVTVCAAPTKVTLKKTKISLKKGKTAQISVKSFTPKKAYCSSFTYKVKSKKIATVSSTGKITAKKKGTTTITVTCKNNKKAKATVKVTVK